MATLDDLKKQWCENSPTLGTGSYDLQSFKDIVRLRVRKQNKMIFRYFWTAFACQNLLYGLLCFVIIRFGAEPLIFLLGVAGIIITIPYTVYMMKRYKQLAKNKINQDNNTSVYDAVTQQRNLLLDFFTFKKSYEIILVPLSSAIGIILTFELFFPGGVREFYQGALITFILTLLSCLLAIRSENQKSFSQPLEDLQAILDDYRKEN